MATPRCAFCEIVAGEADADRVHADADCVAFLDRRPLFPGHVLVVPRRHFETIEELPLAQVGPLFERVQALARAVRVAMAAEGTFIAANNRVSQSVPHLHLHIVPRTKGDGLRGFFWPRKPYDDEAHAERVAEAIRVEAARGESAPQTGADGHR